MKRDNGRSPRELKGRAASDEQDRMQVHGPIDEVRRTELSVKAGQLSRELTYWRSFSEQA